MYVNFQNPKGKYNCPECGSIDVTTDEQNGKTIWFCGSRSCGYATQREFPFVSKEEQDSIDRQEGRLYENLYHEWLIENIGKAGEDWSWQRLYPQPPPSDAMFYFKNEKDAIHFKLRWC